MTDNKEYFTRMYAETPDAAERRRLSARQYSRRVYGEAQALRKKCLYVSQMCKDAGVPLADWWTTMLRSRAPSIASSRLRAMYSDLLNAAKAMVTAAGRAELAALIDKVVEDPTENPAK